jgi:hypothetical protein
MVKLHFASIRAGLNLMTKGNNLCQEGWAYNLRMDNLSIYKWNMDKYELRI